MTREEAHGLASVLKRLIVWSAIKRLLPCGAASFLVRRLGLVSA
jgi:hypothetical protein